MGKPITATEWECEHVNCENRFMRYQYQINNGTGKYCSQKCASYESARLRKSRGEQLGNVPDEKVCYYCKKVSRTWKNTCARCRKIEQEIKQYNLTMEEYLGMVDSQGGLCAICSTDRCITGRRFAVDHDHKTGAVRGLLCYHCNLRLGWYDKHRTAVDKYLQ